MKPANPAPAYCALYPVLAELCRRHGYALAVHGTMSNDFDIVAIPWMEIVSPPEFVIRSLTEKLALVVIGQPCTKAHGRLVYTLGLTIGPGYIDLSFAQPFDRLSAPVAAVVNQERDARRWRKFLALVDKGDYEAWQEGACPVTVEQLEEDMGDGI